MGWLLLLALGLMGLFTVVVGLYILVVGLIKDPLLLDDKPRLSILVAARNEEGAIGKCLRCLDELDYPKDRLEILIGDDGSEDRTAAIVKEFIAGKAHFQYHAISGSLNGLQGKQNVLAQLGQKASGEILLVTDADIRVHRLWAQAMAGAFLDPAIGMVCGPTLVWGRSLFAKMQGLDWLMGQTLSRAHAGLNIPISGVGNNMGIRAKAYRETGGYENLPFHIVEDFQLFHVLCEKGKWGYRLIFRTEIGAESLPVDDLRQWFKQRKRWFSGAKDLAWYNQALILLNAIVLPGVLLAWLGGGWKLGLSFLLAKIAADFLLLAFGSSKLKISRRLAYFLPYEAYYLFSMIVTPILMIPLGSIEWKGRKYA